jgi:hypothetical protein
MTHDRTHLGDGVYASFERGMTWLRASCPNGWHEIALEPYVYHVLTEYAATIWVPGAQPALGGFTRRPASSLVGSSRHSPR